MRHRQLAPAATTALLQQVRTVTNGAPQSDDMAIPARRVGRRAAAAEERA